MSIELSKKQLFERKIIDFFRKAGREHLPWRRPGITAYEVWVSEIMLQQTQVSRVIEYYNRFLEHFPTVEDLAKATWEEFLPYYAGLGYYRRGQNMLLTAKKVVDEFSGEFPRDKKLLMTLPGVGDYTASAILSFAYEDNHLAWDTNLIRVVGRFFFGSKSMEFQRDIFEESFKSSKKELNAALMDFGSAICLGRPKCNTCPLATKCEYFQDGGKQELAMSAKDKKTGKKNGNVDWRQAQVFLWLHREHKEYYSSDKRQFKVFLLPSIHNSRAGIKEYFREKYNLELAVRPPHKKVVIQKQPTLFVNAQILLGEPKFAVFSKDVIKRYNDTIEATYKS